MNSHYQDRVFLIDAWLRKKLYGEKGGWGKVLTAPNPKVEKVGEAVEKIDVAETSEDKDTNEGVDFQSNNDDKK